MPYTRSCAADTDLIMRTWIEDKAVPFVDLFPDIYPERRAVNSELEPNLVGVLIKSVIIFHRQEEALLCRGLVVAAAAVAAQARDISIYTTVHFKVTGIAPVVGYDLDLIGDQDGEEEEAWGLVKGTKHFLSLSQCTSTSTTR